jgi:peptide/nickel transport system ATP-binding protein
VNDPLLSVQGLRIQTGMRTIVDGLDLEIAQGETIGIVGESGSGKTLTARALVGLLPPTVTATGEVNYGGRQLLGGSERAWRAIRGRQIGLMLQDPFTMLSPLMRVGAQVTETIRDAKGSRLSRSDAAAEANARLREVGILDPDVARRYAFQLSGGMRQRVGLAAALASDPRVLIADEPSTALDVTTQREILRLIRQLQEQRGMSVILITHDLRVAFSVCTRIYVLYAGALVEVGDAASLEHAPMHPYTHGLLASEPPLHVRVARLEAIAGTVPPAHDVLGQCAFASRCRWREDECVTGRPLLTERVVGRLTACRRITEISSQLVIRPPSPAPPSVSATSSRALVQVRELTKVYSSHSRPHRALDGVTLEVRHGESVGLVGESGSGKTTLARCLVGLEQPTTGEIRVNEIDATNYAAISGGERAELRRAVQIVFQDPYSTLNPARSIGFTLGEAIRRSPESHGRSKAGAIADLLALVGLPASFAHRKPAALSGGERQRVAIARALALKPQLLICDEPVSALDVSVQAQILNLLAELKQELSLGYLFITHDLAVVRQVTDRMYVLYRGKIVEAGPTAQLLDNPAHEYTRSLLDSIPQSSTDWLSPPPIVASTIRS